MKNKNHIPYVLCMVLGEFFILLDAGFIGYIMSGGIKPQSFEILFFWFFLIGGVLLRFFAEKFKNDEY